jgi:hypothetical protein
MAPNAANRNPWSGPGGLELEDSTDLEDVPAAVLCVHCGRSDCGGCGSLDESTHASRVVAIVPWERPGLGFGERLWGTAKLATTSADSFFGALPEGDVLPAVRFAVVAELCAVTGLCAAVVPFVLALAPTLLDAFLADSTVRRAVGWTLGFGIPGMAGIMVLLHAAHGAGLELGAARNGRRRRRDRGLRFGFYACGWDLVTLPLGLTILAVTDGVRSALRALPLGVTVPVRAARAYLRRVHQLDEAAARRAATFAGRLAGALLLLLLGAGSALGLLAFAR